MESLLISKSRSLLAFVALFGLLLAACGGDQTDSGGPSSSLKPAPAEQQVLRLRLGADPGVIDPQVASGASQASIAKQIGAGLFTYDDDLKIVPQLAKGDARVSPDGMTYTIEIAEDAKWSDGKVITPQDFVYGMQRALDPSVASPYAAFYYSIAGAREYNTALGTTKEPKTATAEELATLRSNIGVSARDGAVEYRLTEPTPSFLNLLALWTSFPARQDIIEKYGAEWTKPGNMVSSGPFVLEPWERDQQLTFKPNPHWAGTKPMLSSLQVKIMPDDSAAYAAYLAGELDAVTVPAPAVKQVQADATLSKQLTIGSDLTTVALFMNNTAAPFDNKLVRQAFGTAIDRNAYVNGVLQGAGSATTTWIPDGMPGHNADYGKQYAFDAARAKDLLKQAGYENGNGLPEITFLMVNNPVNQLTGEFLKAQFKDNLGVDVSFEYLEGPQFGPRFVTGQYQASIQRWHADWPYPDNWLPAQFTTGSRNNVSKYSNAEFDKLMKQAAAETSDANRLKVYATAEKLMLDEAGLVPLYNMRTYTLVKPNVKDLIITGVDGAIKGDLNLWKTFIALPSGE
jgi:oligopeptide transport system substrate-binding protein